MPWLKIGVFILAALPLVHLSAKAFGLAGLRLGGDPVEEVLHTLGWWGLVLLLCTLAVTPLRELLGLSVLARVRRMLGVFSFVYILLHFVTYAVLDQGLDVGAVWEDILERPYITIGALALLLLLPLAITSTNAMVRRLGTRWKTLHRLIYPIAILGVWHFYWQVKKDITEPVLFASILLLLLGYRLYRWRGRVARRKATV